MRKSIEPSAWPTEDGRAYIASDAFGELLIQEAERLQRRYPKMDFSDAVAQVFQWFSEKAEIAPTFIQEKFPSFGKLTAYVRQALWNAGVLSARQRARRSRIEAVSVDQSITTTEPSAQELAILNEKVDRLPYPHKQVLDKIFFEEEDLDMLASIMGKTNEEVRTIYEEAITMLQHEFEKD